MRMMNPSVMVPRLDLMVLELAAAGIMFRRLRGGTTPWACHSRLCSPQASTLVLHWPIRCLLVQKKSPKSFAAFGLRLVLIFYEVKNKLKTPTDTGHYVNRLVPKMI